MTSIQPTLQRWAELEPERCCLVDPRQWQYCVRLGIDFCGELCYLPIGITAAHPTRQQLMYLEFAVRQAAISKDKTILIRRNPDGIWCSMVDAGSEYSKDPAIALLKAYLRFLTWEQNQSEEAIA